MFKNFGVSKSAICLIMSCTLVNCSAVSVESDSLVPLALPELSPLNASSSENWVLDNTRSDEFLGNQVDYKKWKETPKHVQTWTWDNANNIKQSQGLLHIQMRHSPHIRSISNPCKQGAGMPNSQLHFTSGMLQTYARGTTGYYEARIRGVETFPGFSPAFWMYSEFDDRPLEEGSVRYSEIDVVELQQRQGFKEGNERISDHNLHAALTKKNAKANPSGRDWRRPGKYHEQENVHVLDKNPAEHFHVFGTKVSKQEIIWYVDNLEVGRAKNNYWQSLPMSVALSLGLRKPYTEFTCNGFLPIDPVAAIPNFEGSQFNASAPTMLVDYVRVWTLAETDKP